MVKFHATLLLLFFLHSAYTQGDCSIYFPFEEGTTLKYGYYNKKDKLTGTSTQVVEAVENEGNTVTAKINTSSTDAKGKNTVEGTLEVSCADGIFKMDMSEFMPAQATAAMAGGSAEVTITGDGFQLPTNYEVGETLPDAKSNINIVVGGGISMNISIALTDQKILAKEDVTTPAGSFNCIKYTYTSNTDMMFINTETYTETWYAQGVGTVKTISTDKKGKVVSKMVLESFSK